MICSWLNDATAVLQLKNIESGFVVIEFLEGEIRFHDPILKEKMEVEGIAIPFSERKRYGGKDRIFLGDKQFQEAFKEFYYIYQFDFNTYKWM